MEITCTYYASTRNEWREWFEKNHLLEKEVWLIFYKKHTKKPCITYNDAVEEALCFGWIDSTIKRIDEEKYAQKFTPRKNNKNWSQPNRKRIAKLIKEGKITETGLRTITFDPSVIVEESSESKTPESALIPEDIRITFMENPPAWENFMKLAPSYGKNYIKWAMSAKKIETKLKRITELIEISKHNKKLGMK